MHKKNMIIGGAPKAERVTMESIKNELFNTKPSLNCYDELEAYTQKVASWVLNTMWENIDHKELEDDDESYMLEHVVPAHELSMMGFVCCERECSALDIFNFVCPFVSVKMVTEDESVLHSAVAQGLDAFISECIDG